MARGNLPNKLPVQQTEHFNIKLQFVTEATLMVNTPILHGRRADFRDIGQGVNIGRDKSARRECTESTECRECTARGRSSIASGERSAESRCEEERSISSPVRVTVNVDRSLVIPHMFT